MKLSEAIREWKSNITTHMAAEYVLTLRADINAFSDAAQALERENAELRGMVAVLWECCACNTDSFWCEGCDYHDVDGCKVRGPMRKLGIEVE